MIDWSSAIMAGSCGGLAMEFSAAVIRLLGFGCHSMVGYEGCMLTGSESGVRSYLAGMVMHLALSVLIVFAYAWSFEIFWDGGGWLRGLIIAVPHWFAGGLVVPLFDRINGCVARGMIQPLKPFASGSRNAFFTFLIGHLTYGATVGLVYS